MKKILSVLLVLVMLLAVVSCASNKTPDAPASDAQTASSTDKPSSETPTGASDHGESQSGASENSETQNSASENSETPVENKDHIFVTIVDQTGKLALTQEKIELKDADNDGKLTIDDAFVCAHESSFSGGKDGYVTGETQYGVSIFKLWGSDEGKSFMYYLNSQMAMGLSDEVKSGDYLDAFVFCDTLYYSDTYCYFDRRDIKAVKNEQIALTLYKMGFDENFNPTVQPADEGVTIRVNGVDTQTLLDANGQATVSFSEAGTYIVSAGGVDGQYLVPPVCIVTVA